MATIDDFGDTTEPLSQPVLGGPSGWAAAVRDAITALQESLTSGLAGKVSKSGDSMSGSLDLANLDARGIVTAMASGDYASALSVTDAIREGVSFTLVGGVLQLLQTTAAGGITTTRARLGVGRPVAAVDAVNLDYLNGRIQHGVANSNAGEGGMSPVTLPRAYAGVPECIIVCPIAGPTNIMPTIRSSSPEGFNFSVVNTADAYVAVQCFWLTIGAPA